MCTKCAPILCVLALSSISTADNLIIGPFEKLLQIMNIQKQHMYPHFLEHSNYAPIENLDELLSPFEGCNILLTNFRGINIKPTNYPILLREFQLALHTFSDDPRLPELILVPNGMSPFVNSSNILETNCSLSPLLSNGNFYYCMMLNFIEYAMKTRPLLCQVRIDLYPQDYLFTTLLEFKLRNTWMLRTKYPLTFHYNPVGSVILTNRRWQPVNILVVKDQFERQSEWFLNELILRWFNELIDVTHCQEGKCSTYSDIFLLVTTKFIKSQSNSLSRIVSKSVVTFDVETVTSEDSGNAVILHDILGKIWDLSFKIVLSKLNSFYRNHLIRWKNTNVFEELRFLPKFNDRDFSCKNNPYSFVSTHMKASLSAYDRTVVAKLVRDVSINMVKLIIPNATFIKGGEHKCVKLNSIQNWNGIYNLIYTELQTINQSSYIYVPLLMNNPLQTFKFLSCGKPFAKFVGFEEFVSIFEWNIWLTVIIFIVGVFPILFHCVEKANFVVKPENVGVLPKRFSTNDFMQSIVVLLEEGEAFTGSDLKLSSLKWMLASLLIAGTVLSNAYKYDNVYNIIAPKKLIPYRQIGQLTKHNFKIYTLLHVEADNFKFTTWPLRKLRMESLHQIVGTKYQRRGYRNISFCSEVMKLSERTSLDKNVANQSRHLLSITKIHPKTIQILNEIAKLIMYNYITLSLFLKKQWNVVSDAMRVCNRSALIIPELFAAQMAYKLRQDGLKYVYVGKEFLFRETLLLQLRGWIPVNTWGRVGGLETSGIWKWWNDVVAAANGRFAGRESSRASEIVIEKPSMKGNAEIIFQLFCITSAISVFCFLIELSLRAVGKVFFLRMVIWKLRLDIVH
ncbi:unnamed protein product [Orchesella dallaii]|uniref:Uncharacterized protein n=1 Tax=Orchesella dallaii TaxID=48710 RepID=A0ABP1RYH0_9HEXA